MTHIANGFHWADYLVFSANLLVSLGIGVFYACADGGHKSTGDYLMGDRNLKVLPVALSLLVSFISAVGILGTPAEMYAHGTQYSMYIFGAAIGCCYSAYLFVPVFYPLKLTSSFEYFELRYKSKVPRLLGSFTMILMGIFGGGTGLFAPSIALLAVTGFPVWLSMSLCAVVGTIYTCIGGMKAVIWTDVFQSVVIFVGMIVVAVLGVIKVGGLGEVWRLNEEWDRIEFFNFDPDPRVRTTFWTVVVVMSFLWMSLATAQMAVQRYCALPTLAAAKASVLLNIPGFVLMGTLTSLVGVVIFAYYAKQGCDPLSAGFIGNPNQILPYFVNDVMGYPGLSGLFVACLYSGTLSTLSSSLNAMAAVTWEDFLKWKFHYLSPRIQTNIAKLLVVFYGGCSLALGFMVQNMGGTFIQIVFTVMGTVFGPIVGMFFLGALYPRAGPNGALLGSIIGLCISSWMSIGSYQMKYYESPLAFPRDNCPVRNVSMPEGVTSANYSVSANLTEMALNVNGSYGHARPPARVLEGLENLYAISYMWYPVVGIVSVLVVGLVTSCIPGLRQEGYVPKKYLFPFMRRFGRCCQRESGVYDVDEAMEEEAHEERMQEMKHMPRWKGSQSPILSFKFHSPSNGDTLLKEEDEEQSSEDENEAADSPDWGTLTKNNYFKPTDLLAKYDFNIMED